jgi:hypothetical protein
MTIKPQNLLRLMLLLPYFVWTLALLFASLVYGPNSNTQPSNAFLDALAGFASFFTIAIIGWGIPYTILAIGLFLWSINKPAPVIYKAFLFSPILLSILTVVEVALITFSSPQVPSLADLQNFSSYILLAVLPTLILGYALVGVGVGINKVMSRLNLIRTETASREG